MRRTIVANIVSLLETEGGANRKRGNLWPKRLEHEQPVVPVVLVPPNKPATAVTIPTNSPRSRVQAFGFQMTLSSNSHAEGAGTNPKEIVAFQQHDVINER